MEQAKINVKDNEQYKKANEILNRLKKKKDYKPRNPKKWESSQYRTKGITIFLSTAFSTIALTNAILKYDYVSLLTYLLVLIIGVIFGVLQMKQMKKQQTREHTEQITIKSTHHSLNTSTDASKRIITNNRLCSCQDSPPRNATSLRSEWPY